MFHHPERDHCTKPQNPRSTHQTRALTLVGLSVLSGRARTVRSHMGRERPTPHTGAVAGWNDPHQRCRPRRRRPWGNNGGRAAHRRLLRHRDGGDRRQLQLQEHPPQDARHQGLKADQPSGGVRVDAMAPAERRPHPRLVLVPGADPNRVRAPGNELRPVPPSDRTGGVPRGRQAGSADRSRRRGGCGDPRRRPRHRDPVAHRRRTAAGARPGHRDFPSPHRRGRRS